MLEPLCARQAADGCPHFVACVQNPQPIAIGEQCAAPARPAVERLCGRYLKALHTSRERILVISLDEKLDMFAIKANAYDAEIRASKRKG
jgi:hypothetical protein